MSTRYFTASVDVYAAVSAQLDSAYGYPKPETRTERALPLPSELPSVDGLLYLAVDATYCDYNLPSEMLPQLLASGAVVEITEEVYRSALPEAPSPVS
jgi:hypothetical protein